MTIPASYKSTLCRLMSYLDGLQYDKDHVFSDAQLAALTPTDIARWMRFRAYGTAEPGTNVNPTHARSNALKTWKKQISHFMPNKLMKWDAMSNVGNPTKSIEVNDVIQKVMKKEVRKQGKASTARRPATHREFKEAQNILMNESQPTDVVRCHGIPCMMRFQYNLIARIDDTAQFQRENLNACDDWDFMLRCRLNWSNNVNEERDAPNQILIGAMDPFYCVLLALAIWLEIYLGATGQGGLSPYVFGFNDDLRVPEGGEKASKFVQKILSTEIFNRPQFITDKGPLGSHSIRKLSRTHARRNGANKDFCDVRGHWKTNRRIGDVYDDVDLPFPDAKVAAILCIGGPCKYVLKENSGVTENFLLQHVVPNIRAHFSANVAKVLAKPLLWMALSDDAGRFLPQELVDRIKTAYINIRVLPENENPVKKVLLIVTGDEGEVYLDEIGGNLGGDGGAGGGGNALLMQASQRDQLLALYSQVSSLRRALEDLKVLEEQHRVEARREYQMLQSNIRRIAIQPVVRQRANDRGENGAAALDNGDLSSLSPHPRSLHQLWQEYEFGIGGRKAAKLFTPQERGKVKHKYHRRKVVWDCIARLIRAGSTADVAINTILAIYGANTTVTQIINQMKHDRQAGTLHASLQV